MPLKKTVKKGFLSKVDKDYIDRFRGKKSVSEIASHLRRADTQVAQYMAQNPNAEGEARAVVHRLEDRPEWSQFQAQFDDEDLVYLKYRYDQIMTQFGWDDVLPTEEMQLFRMIELEIMARQAMAERKPLVLQQKTISARLQDLYRQLDGVDPQSGPAKTVAKECDKHEAKLGEISTALKAVNIRHQTYGSQINDLLEQLKGTRDQRVKIVEGNKASFLGHLKALTLQDYQKEVGDEMEMMRVATEKEKKRMSAPHLFMDGVTDQPLLTSETVLEDYDTMQPNMDSSE